MSHTFFAFNPLPMCDVLAGICIWLEAARTSCRLHREKCKWSDITKCVFCSRHISRLCRVKRKFDSFAVPSSIYFRRTFSFSSGENSCVWFWTISSGDILGKAQISHIMLCLYWLWGRSRPFHGAIVDER